MLKKVGFLSLVLVIIVVAVGFSASPAAAATCTQWYTVRPGDTLSKIGVKFGVSWTYLAQINHISNPSKIYAGQTICVSTSGQTNPQPQPGTTPYFKIVGVVSDKSVTIQTYQFPPNLSFAVLMGPYGTKGVNGTKVGTYNSGNGSSKTVTYAIPNNLKGDSRIAIRLQNNSTGYFAYNWFWNNTTGGGTGGGGVSPGYTGYPTFSVRSVVRNDTVTIQGYNYPPNTKFDVYMGPYGTKGVGGYFVTSFNSGAGGSISKTFPIPPELYGSTRIAIRTQDGPFYAYNWFWNNTAYAP